MTTHSFYYSGLQKAGAFLRQTRRRALTRRPYLPAEGLAVILLVAAVIFPHDYWPFLLALPLGLVTPGPSRSALAWLALNIIVFITTPSFAGKVFAFPEGILPAITGSFLGTLFRETKTDVKLVLTCLGWPSALLALAQWVAAKPAPWAWLSAAERWLLPTRVTGTFGNPNIFAGFLLVLLPLETVLLVNETKIPARLFFAASLMIHSTVLALTFSHGAWLAAVGIVVLLGLGLRRLSRQKLLFLAAGGVLFVPMLARVPWGSALSYRLQIYAGGLKLFFENPFGFGIGGFKAYYPLLTAAVPAVHSHNIMLQILVEQGLPGLVVFAALLAGWIRRGISITDPEKVGFLAVLGGQLFWGLVDYNWAIPLLTGLFWLAEGFCFGPVEVGDQ